MAASVLIVIISLVLYYMAPEDYDFMFCVTCLVVFAYVCAGLYKKRSRGEGLVNFNTFFLVSFFFVSYAYPVFIHPTAFADTFDMNQMITANNICACTALCTVAICSYNLGYNILFHSKCRVGMLENCSYYRAVGRCNDTWYSISVLGVFFVLYIFFTSFQEVGIEVSYVPFLFILFLISTIIAFVSNTRQLNSTQGGWKEFALANKKVLCFSFLVMLIYMIIGDRLIIVELGLIIICVYSLYFKKVRALYLIAFLTVGFVMMTLLMLTRNSSGSLRTGGVKGFVAEGSVVMEENEASGVWGYTSDLTGRFQELSYGYKMTQKQGHLLPQKIFVTLFSPIPFLPNIISNLLLGVPTSQTSAGYFIAIDSKTHAGSHCVIDIYMPWGVIGLLIFFSLFGVVVAYFDRSKYNNIYGSVGYLVLVYQSVFITRGTIFDVYRTMVWAMVIIYLYNHTDAVKKIKRQLLLTNINEHTYNLD